MRPTKNEFRHNFQEISYKPVLVCMVFVLFIVYNCVLRRDILRFIHKNEWSFHCFENAQNKIFDRENAMKMAKKSKNGTKNMCVFVDFLAILAVCIVLDMKTHFVFSNRHFNTAYQHWYKPVINPTGWDSSC